MKTKIQILAVLISMVMCAALFPQIPVMSGSIEVYGEDGEKLEEGAAADALLKAGSGMEVTLDFKLLPKSGKKAEPANGKSKKKSKSPNRRLKHAEKCSGVRDGNPDGEWAGSDQYPDALLWSV